MRIGIFGDSYTIFNQHNNDHLGLSWVEHLSKIHDVVNFGVPGSSFRWCYELFLKHKLEFDFCIVVVPTPTRVYIKALENLPNAPPGHFFADPLFRDRFKQFTSDPTVLKILDSVDVWYENWRDHCFENHLHNLMVRDVLSNDNVLVIPGFPESVEGYGKPYQNLTDIQYWELAQADPTFDYYHIQCKRKCHLTEENNLVLFSLIKRAMNNKEKILNLDIKHFKKPAKSIDYYADPGYAE
tara:strand:- start:152 stop:871 length:720 start_codon:yes stop_codon:yes gene_type:complete